MLRPLLVPFLALQLVAQTPDPILARLPADTATLFVLRDVMPHVDSFLGSPVVRDLLAASGDLQRELFGRRFDPAALQKQIGLFRALVPTEATVAMSAASTRALLELVRGLAVAAALAHWPAEGDDETRDELRASCAGALRAAADVRLVARVRTRDERTAEGWFDDLAKVVAGVGPDAGIEAKVVDSTLSVQVAPLQVQDGAARRALTAAGVELPADFAPRFAVTLTQDGAELVLRLGAPADGPLPAAKLGRLWRGDASQLLYMQAEFGDAAEAIVEDWAALQTLVDEGEMPPLLVQIAGFLSQLSDLSPKYGGSVAVAERGLTFVSEEDLGAEVPEGVVGLPPAEFARCVAPGEGPFSLASVPLDHLLSAVCDEFQQRLARRGAVPPAKVAGLVEFLQGEDSAVFAPGTLLVSRGGAFRGAKDLVAGPMPWAVGALVAKANSADGARAFMRALGEHLGGLLGRAEPLWAEVDLGLGYPSHELDQAVVPWLRDADADYRPHWLVVGDALVISSDVAFTKDLLQRLGGKAAAALPAGRLVSWSVWRGDHLADVCQGIGAWLPVVDAKSVERTKPFFAATATVAGIIEAFEWITDVDGTILRTRMDLRLRAERPK